MADAEVETSYEANTVAELQEELRSRGLHTSGNKEELIARLEEDDAAGQEDAPDQSPPEPQPEDYYPTTVYSPFELPANTAAAQAFIDAHPESVDETIEMDPDRQAAAQYNIQVHVDTMADAGVTIEDPRLEGYTPPPEPEVPPAPDQPALEEANA